MDKDPLDDKTFSEILNSPELFNKLLEEDELKVIGDRAMDEKLKPCPFCGGEATYIKKINDIKSYIGCSNASCIAEPFSFLVDEAAIKAWNRRVTDEYK